MSAFDPFDRLSTLRSTLHRDGVSRDWVEAFTIVIEQITSFPFTLPTFLERTAEECAQMFSLLLAQLPRVSESELRLSIFEIFEISIHKLTLAEDWLFRGGQQNEALRSLLFQLTIDAGLTPTPTGTEQLSVLDYRYHPEFGSYKQKVGEIAESLNALAEFEQNQSEDTALDALVELGDVFYNMLKLSQDTTLQLNLPAILDGILTDCHPADKDRLVELYFELCNIAIWKYWFRYIQSQGVKNPAAEAIELEKKWTETTQNGSPVEFLQEKAVDCWLLLKGVAEFSARLLNVVMDKLELNADQQAEIRSYLIDVKLISTVS